MKKDSSREPAEGGCGVVAAPLRDTAQDRRFNPGFGGSFFKNEKDG